jgi:hypothetical protein
VQLAPVISGVQRLTPEHLQARVMGAVEALGALCPGLGLVLGGVLVSIGSPRLAFAIVGAGAGLTTLAFARVHLDRIAASPARATGIGPPAAEGAPPAVP